MARRLDEAQLLMADLGRSPQTRDVDRRIADFLSETFDLALDLR